MSGECREKEFSSWAVLEIPGKFSESNSGERDPSTTNQLRGEADSPLRMTVIESDEF
jgi:hypothetical protein